MSDQEVNAVANHPHAGTRSIQPITTATSAKPTNTALQRATMYQGSPQIALAITLLPIPITTARPATIASTRKGLLGNIMATTAKPRATSSHQRTCASTAALYQEPAKIASLIAGTTTIPDTVSNGCTEASTPQ